MTDKQVQNLLQYLGYYNSIPDGDWGPLSEQATRAFQEAFGGIAIDGIPGAETQKALRHAVTYGMPTREPEEPETTGSFWDEIKYWTREEFRCQCGGKFCDGFPAEPDEQLVRLAENARVHFGRPGHRSSGLRCKTWNAIQGGVANSRHLTGKALDFRIEGRTAAQVLAYVKTRPGVRYAYDIDGTYVHMDVE